MTAFSLRRYVVTETAIGIVINVSVSTVPGLLLMGPSAATALTPVRAVAVGLTPQFFMAAFMSALIPSLLIGWRQSRGKLSLSFPARRLRPDRAAAVAAGLATTSTISVLALIHLVVAPLAAGGLGAGAILALRGAQAALAAATVTPVAILLLLGRTISPDVTDSRAANA